MLKDRIKNWLYSRGYELRSTISIPFGVDWHRDVNYFLLNSGDSIKIVFDVGANVGQTAREVIRHFPDSKVYSFEPFPATYSELKSSMDDFDNFLPINSALGVTVGQAEIIEKHSSTKNTLLVERERTSNHESKVLKIEIDTIDNFCSQHNIEQIDILKIDTEGFEMPVLRGAVKMLQERNIQFILAECEFEERSGGDPHGDFAEILDYLKSFNFSVISFYTRGVDQLGWIWGDVLFRLKPDNPSARYAYSPHIPFSPHHRKIHQEKR